MYTLVRNVGISSAKLGNAVIILPLDYCQWLSK